jgi:hypothetical protein
MHHRARRLKGNRPVITSESYQRATNFDKNYLQSAYLHLDNEIKAFKRG